MRLAVDLAHANRLNGGRPFGAVLAQGNEVVATGVNEIMASHDPSTHAEMQAIRSGTQQRANPSLAGLSIAAGVCVAQALTEAGAGFWVMTPLQQADGSQILINRGFTPEKMRAEWLKQISEAGPSSETVTVIGLMRMSEPGGGFLRKNDAASGQWFSRDVAAMSQSMGLPHAAPYFIDLGVPTSNPAYTKDAFGADVLRPGMTVIKFPNSHLVYALTWYGLAAMVLGAAWLVRKHDKAAAKR